jgi:MoaA/NifB/PqqE/SkfB family radical SAM enzyme
MSRVRRAVISVAQGGRALLTARWVLLRHMFAPPPFHGYRPTPRRMGNLYLNRLEHHLVRTRLWSRPTKLIIEPVNACNLRCPCCFTGAGGQGRTRSVMSMELFRSLLEELGDYLLEIEAFNWGEPLLSPHIPAMIAAATARGIGTKLNTNFSLPFDAAKAERLIAAGLTTLTVSIDGARQATYEQYRVRGDLRTVVHNCQLLAAAKRRLRSSTPTFNLEFHAFPHNVGDREAMRPLAAELDMNLLLFKGTVPGPDWDVHGDWHFCVEPREMACASLWTMAIVNNDGGVAPCNGTFYREDDMGAVAPAGDGTATTFRAVWNGPRFQTARRFYRRRAGSPAEREQVCFDCPQAIIHENWTRHVAAGGTREAFKTGYTTNDGWNYFWNRRPARLGVHTLRGLPNTAATDTGAAQASAAAARRNAERKR